MYDYYLICFHVKEQRSRESQIINIGCVDDRISTKYSTKNDFSRYLEKL